MSIKLNNFEIGADKLTILAGPCAIESLDILKKTAEGLKKVCSELDINYVFKSSYDKANRSSITSYRGPGMVEGLKTLAEIKEKFPVTSIFVMVVSGELTARVAETTIDVNAWLNTKGTALVPLFETLRSKIRLLYIKSYCSSEFV